jgi:inosine/xanthosine triphosphate pyrophosphatase family protein
MTHQLASEATASAAAPATIKTWMSRLTDACRYTMPGNETGLPAISDDTGLEVDALDGRQPLSKSN